MLVPTFIRKQEKGSKIKCIIIDKCRCIVHAAVKSNEEVQGFTEFYQN